MPNDLDALSLLLPSSLQPDPFTAGYRALRDGVLLYPPFQRAIAGQQAAGLTGDALAEAARAHFLDSSDGHFEHFDPQIQSADLPEYAMYQTPFDLQPWGTPASVMTFRQSYDLVAITETLNVVPMNFIKFSALIGLRRLGPSLGLGDQYVRDWRIVSPQDNPGSLKDWTRGKIAFVSMLRVEVDFYLDRAVVDQMALCP